MSAPLPEKPRLEQFEENAAALRDFVRAGFDGPVELVRANHPRIAELPLNELELDDARLALARHHGFDDWAALGRHITLVNELSRSPHEQPIGGDLTDDDARADELLRLACLNYGADRADRWAAAAELLADHPQLTGHSIHTAAATGDLAAASAILADDPSAAGREGGPFRWAPLLYLTYSRLPAPTGSRPTDGRTVDPVGVARLLLDHGADPNAGYLWDGLPSPFTALTGVFGRGEQGAPPHPDELALARLLLEAGAEANDSQTIYNRGAGDEARDDTAFLELLFEFGLGQGDGGPWRQRLGHEHQSPTEMVAEALQHAAERDLPNRVRVLLANGADPNQPGCHPTYDDRRPYEGAVLHGNLAVAALLEAAGADPSGVDDETRVVGTLLATAPEPTEPGETDAAVVAPVRAAHPDLVARAAELGRPAAVRRLAGLGFDVNHRQRTTALHEAAWRNDRATVDALLDLGADPTIVDTEFDSPPAGWADHNGHRELAAYLRAWAPPP